MYHASKISGQASFMFFSCCDAVIAHINPCFYLNDLSKSSVSKTKIREASKCLKKDFESPKLVYANKASSFSM